MENQAERVSAGLDGGEAMDDLRDSDSAAPKQDPDPRPTPGDSAVTGGWLYDLNSFLERAFLKADVDTGC